MNRSLLMVLVVPSLLLGCSNKNASSTSSSSGSGTGASGGSTGGSSGSSTGGTSGTTGISCNVHASSPSHFTDATEAWNLGHSGLGVTGNRIIAADLDGDGYPDLIVHPITGARSLLPLDDGGIGPQRVHVLMNRPRPDGGRFFLDGTVASGIFKTRDTDGGTSLRAASLAIAGDINNDGALDLFSGANVDPTHPERDVGDRSEILLNDGSGHFALAPPSDPHPDASTRLPTTGATFTDVDHDGKVDLFVGYWYAAYGQSYLGTQAQLFGNNGDGTFTSLTAGAGLLTDSSDSPSSYDQGTNSRPAYGVTACDLDGDGYPELMISAYGRQWNQLYQNNGQGHFAEIGQDSGFAADSNLNYKDNQFFACYCTLHASQADCAGVAPPLIGCPNPADSYWSPGFDDQPWRLGGNNFSTYCGDLNGDGKPDLYTAGIHHWHIGQSGDSSELLVSRSAPGSIHFDRPGNAATGLGQVHANASWNEGNLMVAGADLDNDGRPDLVVASSDYPDNFGLLFHQKPDHTFEEVGQSWGMHHACMSGLTVADFDRDGDLDVVVGSGTARDCSRVWSSNEVHLYENDASTHGKWLIIKLRGDGTTANTTGFGARVTVHAGGEDQVQELQGGYGHMAMENDTVLFFGLGACASVDSVSVRWPDRALTVQTFANVASNRVVELRQGDATVHDISPR
jgi:hypothetical protein